MAAASSEHEITVIRDKQAMRSWSRSRRSEGKTVALVPTMGFLHEGHLDLVRRAASAADATVVSIYVNPGQFAPSEDLAAYPSDLSGDLRKLARLGCVHAVFCPSNLYDYGQRDKDTGAKVAPPPKDSSASCLEAAEAGGAGGGAGHETWIRVERLEQGLCGRSRPIFFRGVATVVAKLFNIVEPDVAVFGKKDYQQWRLICRMVRDLDLAVQILGSEIVRESDGLAMSSRNVRLSHEEREKALSISKSLSEAKSAAVNGQRNCSGLQNVVVRTVIEAGGKIDYVEIVDQETLIPVEEIKRPVVICVAAWFGNVRLIDNVEISN